MLKLSEIFFSGELSTNRLDGVRHEAILIFFFFFLPLILHQIIRASLFSYAHGHQSTVARFTDIHWYLVQKPTIITMYTSILYTVQYTVHTKALKPQLKSTAYRFALI